MFPIFIPRFAIFYDFSFSSFREVSDDCHHRSDERMEQQDLHHVQEEVNRERLRAFL